MKHYKNEKNKLWAFDDDCLDEEGKCINEYALKVIEENNLVEITEEEAKELSKPIRTKEQLIAEINQKAYQETITLYPEWKQINIARMKNYNTEAQLEYKKMIAFIDEIRAYSDLEVMNLDDAL